MSGRRPWTVFVQQIGPTFTFASEDRARQRALDLGAEGYGTIEVWHSVLDGGNLRERWEYRDGVEHRQYLTDAGWVDSEKSEKNAATLDDAGASE